MRTWPLLLLAIGCVSCGDRKSGGATPAVSWTIAWRWDTPSSATLSDADVILVRDPTGHGSAIALDIKNGRERWRFDDWIVSGINDRRLFAVEEQPSSLVAREIDAATGKVKRSIAIERPSLDVEWVVIDGAVVTMDRIRIQAFSLDSGELLWSAPCTRRKVEFLGYWTGLAVFQHPYAAISTETGEQVWSASGFGFAAELDRDRTVVQISYFDEKFAVVKRDGSITTWPGKVHAVQQGAIVYERAGAVYLFDGATNESRLLPITNVLPSSPMTMKGGGLYFYTADSVLHELDLATGALSDVCRCAAVPENVILSAPIVDGDRVYVDDNGWVAIDRWPSKNRAKVAR